MAAISGMDVIGCDGIGYYPGGVSYRASYAANKLKKLIKQEFLLPDFLVDNNSESESTRLYYGETRPV